MAHTYKSDAEIVIQFARDILTQFAKDQGWDLPDVREAIARLESAILSDLSDYNIPAQ
jgi:hypothetical protein